MINQYLQAYEYNEATIWAPTWDTDHEYIAAIKNQILNKIICSISVNIITKTLTKYPVSVNIFNNGRRKDFRFPVMPAHEITRRILAALEISRTCINVDPISLARETLLRDAKETPETYWAIKLRRISSLVRTRIPSRSGIDPRLGSAHVSDVSAPGAFDAASRSSSSISVRANLRYDCRTSAA